MWRISLVPVLLLSLSLSDRIHADPGLYELSSREIPAKVADSAKHTFRAIFFQERTRIGVSKDDVAAVKTGLKDEPLRTLNELRMVSDGMLARVLLSDLEALPADKNFPLHGNGLGSGFFLKDGWFVTARHVLTQGGMPDGYYAATTANTAREKLGTWKGRLVLVDREGKIRFDTKNGKHSIEKVIFSGHPAEVVALPEGYGAIERTAKAQMLDVVVFQLKGIDTKDIALELATEAPKVDAPIFSAGYPMKTERMLDAIPDADGLSLRVSKGKVLPGAPADYQKFLAGLMKEKAARELYESALLFGTADFIPGMSGGPSFDEQGRVVSLASTVRHDPKFTSVQKYTLTASYGPRFSILLSLLPPKK